MTSPKRFCSSRRFAGSHRYQRSIAKLEVERLVEEPYASIVCYPRATRKGLRERLRELQKLGITTLEFVGKKQVANLEVLGKGCVGIVTIAYKNEEKVALKIRRTDAGRESMLREAELLKKANQTRVGPRLLDASRNFLTMQFVEGELLPEWLEKGVSRKRARKVLRDILEQCYRLDMARLDHGELSHAPKHIIIDKEDRAFIVDFETASTNRRASNVTSVCQFLFINKAMALLTKKFVDTDGKSLVDALRTYKNNMNRESFEGVLESCGF